ncbi:MAG: TonB-dependent receptor [Gemmatimonadota bacterium]
MRTLRPTLLLLSGLLVLSAAAPLLAQEREDSGTNSHVRGLVVDHASEEPLATVRVALTGPQGEQIWAGVSDIQGRFRIPLLPPGGYRLTLSRIAYRTTTEDLLVPPGAEVDVRVQLTPEALEMEPVIVTSARRSRLQAEGFYHRERYFHGEFMLRSEIEDRNPIVIPDLLRMNPAFRVVGTAEPVVLGRGGCPPAVFLDGMRLEYTIGDPTMPNPFNMVQPDQLAAMEVYAGAMTPAQFYTRGACGAVVMWTHQGDIGPGGAGQGRGLRPLVWIVAIATGLHLIL